MKRCLGQIKIVMNCYGKLSEETLLFGKLSEETLLFVIPMFISCSIVYRMDPC